MSKTAVDELVYNEQHNELLFVKYLPEQRERMNA